MKHLFKLLKSDLLDTFSESNTNFHLENFKIENGQLDNMEEFNSFLFPCIFFSYDTPQWNSLRGGDIRYAPVEFTLNLQVEYYQEMEDEDALVIDDYIEYIKNRVVKLSYSASDYYISLPWVIEENKSNANNNLMGYSVTFRCMVTDASNSVVQKTLINDLELKGRISVPSGDWILSSGYWDDMNYWRDEQFWID